MDEVQRQNARMIQAYSMRAPPVSMRAIGPPTIVGSRVIAQSFRRTPLSFPNGDARLEPYDTMVLKYSEFTVSAPGAEYAVFNGTRGTEKKEYETLRATPNAALSRRNMRAGDLARTVHDLASYRFSTPGDVLWPDEMRQIADRDLRIPVNVASVTTVTFDGDLDGELATILVLQGLRPHMIVIRAGVRNRLNPQADYSMVVHMAVFDIRAAALSIFRQILNDVDRSVIEVRDLHAAALAASDKRLVCVTGIEGCSNCERALRYVHASLALLAQKGMISGGSLVAINTRGCGLNQGKSEARKLVQCIEKSPYAYKMQTIGELLLFRADEFVAPLHSHRTLRAAEIGAYIGGVVPRFSGSSAPRRGTRR
jgi:hypothetical protein